MTAPAPREFHFRDCAGDCWGSCTRQLREGDARVMGEFARGGYRLDAWVLSTVFVGRYEDPSTWKRVPRAVTPAGVTDPQAQECRHFVPAGEFCGDCAGGDDPLELSAYELEDRATPDELEFSPVDVALW